MKNKVLLVDDHEIFSDGIMAIIRNLDSIQILGNVTSGEDAVNKLDSMQPDIIIMDVMMSGMNGFEATRIIKEQNPEIKVLILSSEVTRDYVSMGIKSGIDGYITKQCGKNELIEAIKTISAGKQFFNSAITNLIFEDFYSSQRAGDRRQKRLKSSELSKRENEVLELIADGKSNQETADLLFISIKTVETHKMNILEKLGLKNTAELVKYTIKNGIITLE